MPTHPSPSARRPRSVRLEELEPRHAPATFTVTTVLDNGSNTAPTAGSLREAILKANATAGADTINFAIPGTGFQTITPPAPLPNITDAVTIDATSQTGYSGSPVVQLSGTSAGASADGLDLVNTTGSVVKGLTINGFKLAGVRIDGGSSNKVVACYIGLNENGTGAAGNTVGVVIQNGSTANSIGANVGNAVNGRLVIGGNTGDGVEIVGASKNQVVADFIGTDANGINAVANGGSGVVISAGSTGNTIGGDNNGDGNVIAGNTGNGVVLTDPATAGNVIAGNRIGLNFSPGSALANGQDGVLAQNGAGSAPAGGFTTASINDVRKNTISQNKANGVHVTGTSRHLQLDPAFPNSIYANGQAGVTVDATANAGLAAPTITKATPSSSGSTVTVTGTVAGQPNTQYQINFFLSPTVHSTGIGEGQNAAGSTTVTTDAAGNANYTGTTTAGVSGTYLTAAATAVPTGDTSAFSTPAPLANTSQTLQYFAVGADAGGGPQATVYSQSGSQVFTLNAFDPSFTGGVRVAVGDVNGDGTPDLIAATGPGIATQVRIFDGKTQAQIASFQPFEASFTGGLYVAAADINRDGHADVIVTPDQGGGPVVAIYDGAKLTAGQTGDTALLTPRFFGIVDPNFRGGARAAAADMNGDGVPDVAVAAGFGGGPRVSVWEGVSVLNGSPKNLFNDFFAFEQTLRNGVFIAAGDVNGDGQADLIAGGGPGGGPRVTVFNGASLLSNQQVPLANFFAGDPNNRGGVRLAAHDLTNDGLPDLITSPGPGGGSTVSIYNATALTGNSTPGTLLTEQPFPGFNGGMFVG